MRGSHGGRLWRTVLYFDRSERKCERAPRLRVSSALCSSAALRRSGRGKEDGGDGGHAAAPGDVSARTKLIEAENEVTRGRGGGGRVG